MKKRWILLASAVILIITLLFPGAAMAGRPDTERDNLYQAVVAAADRLVAIQGSATATIPYNWEWIAGSGNYGSANQQGIGASGVLAAYEKTRDRKYLAAAINAGNTLKNRYNTTENAKRPYSQDVEFLVKLSRVTRDRTHYEVAKNWYANMIRDYTAVANVDRLIKARGGSMAGWDIASQIRAADATGNKDYARDMATHLISRSADWVHKLSYGYDYTNLSYGALLWAFQEIGGFHDTINEYREYLLGVQGEDGSWDDGDFQNTAYIVLGLDAVKGAGRESRGALAKAGSYLISTQADNGGWPYVDETSSTEYPEVDSEVLMSLACFDGLYKAKADKHSGSNGHGSEHHGPSH